MHEENLNLKESHRTLLDKLTKAKQVIFFWFLFHLLLPTEKVIVYKISRQTLQRTTCNERCYCFCESFLVAEYFNSYVSTPS